VAPLIEKSLRFSPIVGLFGHRQVGKTTLCEGLAAHYLTLDRADVLELAMRSPETLLRTNAGSPLVIDECQLAPPLFPALKEWVRTHKAPGQLLLTGSVRFSSRKAIRESLTGRIVTWPLLPMDLSEAHGAPLPDAVPRLLASKGITAALPRAPYFSTARFIAAIRDGGLPGVFFVRDAGVRRQRFETQVEAMLERDLRLLVQTTLDLRTLRNLLVVLARGQAAPLDLAAVARATRVSVPSVRRLVAALEAMFVIQLVETEGSRSRPVLFFEDQGEATHLAGDRPDPLLDLTRFLFSFVRQQWVYRPELGATMFQYRSRGGAYVPLAVRCSLGTLGFIPMLDETPGRHELASARSFQAAYLGARCAFVHLGDLDRTLGGDLRVVPLAALA